ncbi:MAG: NAD(P)H-binding protein [Bacteroidales bacterium]|jgi:uncharacterized protein YbjT (DUF2867 family)|nr:NAD(P)H-binding protein [Bacteroidales bacterium]
MDKENKEFGLFCNDLPTSPATDGRIILVTGANGYVGGKLVPELIARGYNVRIMVRHDLPEYKERWPEVEVAVADALNFDALSRALKDVHSVYYLIHSLGLGHKKFESADIQIATNFRQAAENQNVKRIIYLGGLGDTNAYLSPHLENRIMVAQELSGGKIPVTVLRAAMIIGCGSASYEMLKNLVKNTPVFFIPKWAKTKTQPISIRGVIKYLVGVLEIEATASKNFDIGGDDILTYADNLRIMTKVLGKKRLFLPGLISSPSLYAFAINLLTPVPGPIIRVLVEGCKNEVICQNNDIKKYLDIELLSFKEAIYRANLIEKNILISSERKI